MCWTAYLCVFPFEGMHTSLPDVQKGEGRPNYLLLPIAYKYSYPT
jgi:hypothetical protein